MRFPDFIKPNIFDFELFGVTFALTWYALSYILGIAIAWFILLRLIGKQNLWRSNKSPFTPKNIDDLATFLILGIIVGGRLGYVIFYNPSFYFNNPMKILFLWEGGMSFHGGFLGVVFGGLYFSIKNKISVLSMGDLIATSTPPGLFLGRLANFANQELWGKPTESVLGVQFTIQPAKLCPHLSPQDVCLRHPSQLYEAAMEGAILALVLLFFVFRLEAFKNPGRTMGIFFLGYGSARIIVEIFRQPDSQYVTADNPAGYVIDLPFELGLSMGQSLSVPMVIIGSYFILNSLKFRSTS